jgi:hypothetical protein
MKGCTDVTVVVVKKIKTKEKETHHTMSSLPEIEIKKKNKKHCVMSMGHCYGRFDDKKEAIELKRLMDHYRNNAHLSMFCNGLDGLPLIGDSPPLQPLTSEQITSLQGAIGDYKRSIVVHPMSGATFFIKSMNAHSSVASPFVAASLEIELVVVNGT